MNYNPERFGFIVCSECYALVPEEKEQEHGDWHWLTKTGTKNPAKPANIEERMFGVPLDPEGRYLRGEP